MLNYYTNIMFSNILYFHHIGHSDIVVVFFVPQKNVSHAGLKVRGMTLGRDV